MRATIRAFRLLLAFAAGIALYQATVFVAGVLAAVPIPRTYFEWFGSQHLELALAVLQFFGLAVPIIVLVALGTLAAVRALGTETKYNLLAVLGGLAVCFIFRLVVDVFPPSADPAVEALSPLALLRRILLPPWWAASGSLAPWLGFALAAWLALRSKRGEA